MSWAHHRSPSPLPFQGDAHTVLVTAPITTPAWPIIASTAKHRDIKTKKKLKLKNNWRKGGF